MPLQDKKIGSDKLRLAKLLREHHCVVRGGAEEGQKLMNALLVSQPLRSLVGPASTQCFASQFLPSSVNSCRNGKLLAQQKMKIPRSVSLNCDACGGFIEDKPQHGAIHIKSRAIHVLQTSA